MTSVTKIELLPSKPDSKSRYVIHEGLLWLDDPDFSIYRLVLPKSLIPIICESFHSSLFSGHVAANKCYKQIRRRFYWPGMAKDVALLVQSCSVCLASKHRTVKPYGLMQNRLIPLHIFAQERHRKLFNPIHSNIIFPVGAKVMIAFPNLIKVGESRAFANYYTGLYEILSCLSNNNYSVRSFRPPFQTDLVHVRRLRLYTDRPDHLQIKSSLPTVVEDLPVKTADPSPLRRSARIQTIKSAIP